MAYVALYRKFRPETFEEVKGQEAIVRTLKNQMLHDRVGHAYLFCGTRGTGKTSVAKLLAKAVNCTSPKDGSPCGECESCRKIAAGSAMNVIEIDAASNNGVENIRQINEGVQYAPTDGRKMVYIIDEVHMLSTGAFNALLKTLEEPPSYVLFILATTELHKVPVTIRSRCQRYDFHRIPYSVIADRMQEILDREGEKATREALDYIARAADGSMRDALSLLDQCVSYHLGEELTLDKALTAIGSVDVDLFVRLTKGIIADDTVEVMDIIFDVVWKGSELTRFTEEFSMFLRNVLFLKLSPELGRTMDLTEETLEVLRGLGQEIPEDTLQRQIHVLQELLQELRVSTLKRITLEMGILRLMRPEMDTDLTGVLGRLDRLEQRADHAETDVASLREKTEELEKRPVGVPMRGGAGQEEPASGGMTPEEREAMERQELEAELRENFPEAQAEELLQIAENWNRRIIPQLSSPHRSFMNALRMDLDRRQEGEAVGLVLYVPKEEKQGGAAENYYKTPANLEALMEEVSRVTERRVNIRLVFAAESKKVQIMPGLSKIRFDGIEVK